MASASRLFTAATAENNGQRWPLLPLLRSLSLLTARVSVKWKRVSGTMAARQRARLPPTRMLNRGARGPCHRGNNSTGGAREREGVAPRHPLQPGMVRCSLGGLRSDLNLWGLWLLIGEQITNKTARNQYVGHMIKFLKELIKGRISVPSECWVHLANILYNIIFNITKLLLTLSPD